MRRRRRSEPHRRSSSATATRSPSSPRGPARHGASGRLRCRLRGPAGARASRVDRHVRHRGSRPRHAGGAWLARAGPCRVLGRPVCAVRGRLRWPLSSWRARSSPWPARTPRPPTGQSPRRARSGSVAVGRSPRAVAGWSLARRRAGKRNWDRLHAVIAGCALATVCGVLPPRRGLAPSRCARTSPPSGRVGGVRRCWSLRLPSSRIPVLWSALCAAAVTALASLAAHAFCSRPWEDVAWRAPLAALMVVVPALVIQALLEYGEPPGGPYGARRGRRRDLRHLQGMSGGCTHRLDRAIESRTTTIRGGDARRDTQPDLGLRRVRLGRRVRRADVGQEQLCYAERRLAALAECAGVGEGALVLDIGTGTGNSAVPFLERGCGVVGIDPSERMLAQAREKAGALGRAAPRSSARTSRSRDPVPRRPLRRGCVRLRHPPPP